MTFLCVVDHYLGCASTIHLWLECFFSVFLCSVKALRGKCPGNVVDCFNETVEIFDSDTVGVTVGSALA